MSTPADDADKWAAPVHFTVTLPDGREVPADSPEAEAFLAGRAAKDDAPPAADED